MGRFTYGLRSSVGLSEKEYYKDDLQRHTVLHAIARRDKYSDADDVLGDMAVCEHECGGVSPNFERPSTTA